MRWLTPPPQRTAYFSRARSPAWSCGCRGPCALVPSRTSAHARVAVAMPERRHSRFSALRSAGEQVAGAGGDGQQLLAGLDAVAVLDVPLDLELVGADDREDGLGDPQARDDARLAGGEVAGGDGVLGDGRDGRHVHAVVEVLLDGEVRDVLDLDGVEARRRPAAGRARGRGRTPAVPVLVAAAAAASPQPPQAQPGRRSGSAVRPRGEADGLRACSRLSRLLVDGASGGGSGRREVCGVSVRA